MVSIFHLNSTLHLKLFWIVYYSIQFFVKKIQWAMSSVLGTWITDIGVHCSKLFTLRCSCPARPSERWSHKGFSMIKLSFLVVVFSRFRAVHLKSRAIEIVSAVVLEHIAGKPLSDLQLNEDFFSSKQLAFIIFVIWHHWFFVKIIRSWQNSRQSWLYHLKFFKGCLPQILLGPFLKTLLHLIISSRFATFMSH